MQLLRKLAIAAAIFLMPALTFAWGNQGHRITGQIADSYLTPKARASVKKILGNESIALASNWADFIRSDPNYKYLDSWHFVDFSRTLSYPEMVEFLEHDNTENAYTKLKFLANELKNKNLPQAKKLMDLRMLIHLAEDIHQPMHTALDGTQGGNTIKLQWFGKPTSLHTVWDSELINFQDLSYTEYTKAINFTTPAQRVQWQKDPIAKWVFESNQLSAQIIADTKPDSNLSYSYNFKYIATVNQQLLKGGVRLAGLLNQIFG